MFRTAARLGKVGVKVLRQLVIEVVRILSVQIGIGGLLGAVALHRTFSRVVVLSLAVGLRHGTSCTSKMGPRSIAVAPGATFFRRPGLHHQKGKRSIAARSGPGEGETSRR